MHSYVHIRVLTHWS